MVFGQTVPSPDILRGVGIFATSTDLQIVSLLPHAFSASTQTIADVTPAFQFTEIWLLPAPEKEPPVTNQL